MRIASFLVCAVAIGLWTGPATAQDPEPDLAAPPADAEEPAAVAPAEPPKIITPTEGGKLILPK